MTKTLHRTTGAAFLVALVWLAAPALGKPLPSDTRILSGKLDNGATWMYRKHDNPPGKMALIVHLDSGSLNETDAQQGLAHFLEHMAFNGTENFAPGELIPYFESIGMEFGADLNAFTSFDQTAYMLFTPDTEQGQLDKALMVLSDYAYRCLLLDEELDKERGVILEEARTGKNAFQRIRDEMWPKLFEGSRFAQRLPIGKEDVIAKAPRSEFVDYYRTWYRPENVTVILVGDEDAEKVLPSIKKWFGEYKPETPPREAKGPEFKPFTAERALVETDPEMPHCEVGMLDIRAGRPPTTTVEQWRTELVESIGTWIVNRRYEELMNKGEASYREASADVSNFFNDALLVNASATGEPEKWTKMLEELITEVHRAREFGFTARELDLAKTEILADAERAVRTESTSNARRFMFQMVFATNEREPILSAQQELDLYKELLPTVELAEVNETFAEHFRPGAFAYTVEMIDKEGVPVPPTDEVLAAARAAWAHKVQPLDQADAPTELLTALPEPGKVVESDKDADLGVTRAWLDNGVRVHHRFMDYKEDTVFVSIALAGGQIEETEENAGVTEVACLAVNEAATSRLTSTNVRDIMTGKNISVSAGGEGDSLTIRVTGSPKDLESGLQEVHALLTDGRIEESAFKNWKLATLQRIDMMQKMPIFKAFEASTDLLSGGDPRQTFITAERVEKQSVEKAQAWFERLAKEAPIEVAIVGEIPLETAMPLIERYIGSLPKRSRTAGHLDKLRQLARSTGPLTRHVDVETMTPQGAAMAGFAGCEGRNVHDRRALRLASNIMSSRLVKRIREELSWVYSIRAQNNPAWIYRDAGQFGAGAPCDPDNVEKVAGEIHAMFKDFAENGPTDEELANAKKQVATDLDTEMKEPNYWWRILAHHDLHGRDLEDEKVALTAYEPFTAQQVRAAFGKYYVPTRQFLVTAVPVKAKTSEEQEAEKQPAEAPSS